MKRIRKIISVLTLAAMLFTLPITASAANLDDNLEGTYQADDGSVLIVKLDNPTEEDPMFYTYTVTFGGKVYSDIILENLDITMDAVPNYSSDESIQFADSQLIYESYDYDDDNEYIPGANAGQGPTISSGLIGDDKNGYLYRGEDSSDHSFYLVMTDDEKEALDKSANWFKILKTYKEVQTVEPTTSKVLVDGVNKSFDSYTINGNNYFKLRDLACVLNGTDKQFQVSWDDTNKAINLKSGSVYTAVGGELASGDGTAKPAVLNTSKIYKDGSAVALTAYTINGNNYFKLRDLGQAFDFGVNWDNTSNTISIDTSTGYSE